MANELAIGLVIGAAIQGSFQAAFGKAQQTVERLGKSLHSAHQRNNKLNNQIERSQRRQRELWLKIYQAQRNNAPNLDQLKRRYEQIKKSLAAARQEQLRFNAAIVQSEKSQQRLSKAISRQQEHLQKRQALRGSMVETGAHGMAVAMPIWKSVKTFIEQEESANNLKIAMMKADGTFGEFEQIAKIAGDLGRDLPGTRKDFYDLARALKNQGIRDDTLLNGGLQTSAKLNVLLDMDQASGGEFFAKMLEAHDLSEKDIDLVADDLQKAMFAAGMNKEQMYGAMSYYASNVRSMKLTGRENTQKIFAIEGLAAQQGMEGTSFGTGFSTMLDRMNKGPKMLAEAKKGMKAEAADIMDKSGVAFEFWDKKGNFKGINGMMAELEKLDIIRQKFGDEGAGLVAEGLFGVEGKRLALLLAEKGQKGLDEFLAKMQEQATLEERIAQKTSTLASALEQLGGVWESTVGSFGSAFAQDIKRFANEAQVFIENRLTPWIEQNKGLIKTVAGVIGGLLAMKLGILGIGYAVNLAISPFISLWTIGSKINAVFNLMRLAHASGQFAKVSKAALFLSKGIGLVKVAVVALGRALMTNPIGLVITAIGIAAFVIYQYWEPIKGFFSQLWEKVKNIFSQFWQFACNLWNGITGIWSAVWDGVSNYFSGIWQTIQALFSGNFSVLGDLILAFNPLSLFTTVFSSVLSYFGINLPNEFTNFGKNIIDGLVNGIKNTWESAKNVVAELGSGIKNWFAEKLGIHSPSRVFMGFGENTVQGLAIGLSQTAGQAIGVVDKLSDNMQSAISTPIIAPALEMTQLASKAIEPALKPMPPTVPAKITQTRPSKATKRLPQVVEAQPVFSTNMAMTAPQSGGFWSNLWQKTKDFGKSLVDWFRPTQTLARTQDWRTPSFNPKGSETSQGHYRSLRQQYQQRQANSAGQQGITIHFNPTIQLNGNQDKAGILNDLQQGLNLSLRELEELIIRTMNHYQDGRRRRAY
ncbi:TP901 family phage tail tape measure protein [Volucribacter psittacicida]|uniref:TP901 family phage tail tape measure protein n=1 Tax=Volucribacter psittacicida TaxID=203482 RepID=A0A4R1FMY8_9PAST|nr:phage tail tape measure protein [Volucribacter psittacicida]TCJ95963.1 TP901 family phage tail tape measure protein [Volucribacter psittacicida]